MRTRKNSVALSYQSLRQLCFILNANLISREIESDGFNKILVFLDPINGNPLDIKIARRQFFLGMTQRNRKTRRHPRWNYRFRQRCQAGHVIVSGQAFIFSSQLHVMHDDPSIDKFQLAGIW